MRKCFRATKSDGTRMVKGYVRYNATNFLVYPNVVTLAAVLDAVPLPDGSEFANESELVFDVVKEWAGFDALVGLYAICRTTSHY